MKKHEALREIAEDLIKTKFITDKEMAKILNRFYEIMRKHGICEGTLTQNKKGRIINNYEWTMCRDLFIRRIQSDLDMADLLGDVTPSDLKHY